MRFYITGVSGTGKSTVVTELNKRGVISFDIDSIPNLCHWRHKMTGEVAEYWPGIGKDWIEVHEYVCDITELKKLLGGHEGPVVVAGCASNQDDYLSLFDKV